MTENIDSYFENGKGFKPFPFRKGYLTDEERKQPFRWFGNNFIFFSKTVDLSAGIEIYRNQNYSMPMEHPFTWENNLLRDCMQFGIWWTRCVLEHLNGFAGFDTINIEIDPSLNIQLEIKL